MSKEQKQNRTQKLTRFNGGIRKDQDWLIKIVSEETKNVMMELFMSLMNWIVRLSWRTRLRF
jgi:hypothetical protein